MKKIILITALLLVSISTENRSESDDIIGYWEIGSYQIIQRPDLTYQAIRQGIVSEKKKTAYNALKSIQ